MLFENYHLKKKHQFSHQSLFVMRFEYYYFLFSIISTLIDVKRMFRGEKIHDDTVTAGFPLQIFP